MRLLAARLRCGLLRFIKLGDSLAQLLGVLNLSPPAPQLQQLTIRCCHSITSHHGNNQDVCHQLL